MAEKVLGQVQLSLSTVTVTYSVKVAFKKQINNSLRTKCGFYCDSDLPVLAVPRNLSSWII